jgi:hypothetical protein
MSAPFQLTPQATEDLDAIWWFIAEDSRKAADQGGNGNPLHLSSAGETSSDGDQTARHNAAARAFSDRHEIP